MPCHIAGVIFLEGDSFAIGTMGHDNWVTARVIRAEYVGPQDEPIIHLDRHIPVNMHFLSLLLSTHSGTNLSMNYYSLPNQLLYACLYEPLFLLMRSYMRL